MLSSDIAKGGKEWTIAGHLEQVSRCQSIVPRTGFTPGGSNSCNCLFKNLRCFSESDTSGAVSADELALAYPDSKSTRSQTCSSSTCGDIDGDIVGSWLSRVREQRL